ncbi:Zn-ribbon domain-containing OB-fold protein [Nocardia asteroides]|uniref:Zn-ribbon domain-containing OB-fold protein n=1 Tax=Nocardia asteroides TaxID=1824 RepID=UPI00341C93ED
MQQHTPVPVRDENAERVRRIDSTLMIRSCPACTVLLSPQSSSCSFCGTFELVRVHSSGLGWIVSWKIVHHQADRLYGEVEPSIIAVVELDDGPWVFCEIAGAILPPSDRRVRAYFCGRHVDGRYPVFALEMVQTASSTRTKKGDEVSDIEARRLAWVRTSLQQCDLLARSRSVNVQALSLIKFAIRWAPFGGADSNELLVTFGVTRARFLRLISDSLSIRANDSRSTRSTKTRMLDALLSAWQADPDG